MDLKRLVPLTGVAAVVMIFAGLAVAGSTPGGTSSVSKVVTYYVDHTRSQKTSGVLLSLGALLFLVFAATFAARVRPAGADPLGAVRLCLMGAVVLVIGLTIYAGLSIATADVAPDVTGSGLQALNVLANDAVFVFLITIGTCAFLLGAAMATFTTPLLPRWLGWLALVVAFVGVIPSHVLGGALDHIGFAAFAGLGIWTLIVGVLLTLRSEAA